MIPKSLFQKENKIVYSSINFFTVEKDAPEIAALFFSKNLVSSVNLLQNYS